jgi:hypothetical protein
MFYKDAKKQKMEEFVEDPMRPTLEEDLDIEDAMLDDDNIIL